MVRPLDRRTFLKTPSASSGWAWPGASAGASGEAAVSGSAGPLYEVSLAEW